MILGNVCTRCCGFCAVEKGNPAPLDQSEPERVAEAAAALDLKYAVITSVTRDDCSDGGAGTFATVIRAIRARLPACKVEVLIPDFQGLHAALDVVLEAGPDTLNHNIETVARLYPQVRHGASYQRSLDVLAYAKRANPRILTKSGLMLGLGESTLEVLAAMRDLRDCGVDVLTIGQYLRPSHQHLPIQRYASPEEFAGLRRDGLDMGYKHVESAPLVRSSYHAADY
jgi:lipoic acid synthetase